MNDDEKAIRELVQKWMDASEASDTAAVLDLMADDVVFSVPGREPFGKEQFAADSKAIEGMKFKGVSEIVELEILGNWAWMRNHLTVTVTPPNSNTMTMSGYTLTILKKNEGGRWLLSRDANMLTPKT